jgi:cytochrome c oxidase subunit 2
MKIKFLASLFIAVLFTIIVFSYHVHAQGTPERVEIVSHRFSYAPNEITLKKGVPVVLVLTSKDVDHGLKFKELNLNIKVKKGGTSEVTFTPNQVGTFVGQCSVFCGSGHGSMKMSLHVTE